MTPEPLATAPRQDGFTVAQVWLDSLARGACDEEAFLRAMQAITQRSPEEGWDCLSLLDQYYRRGKINSETFSRLKTQLGNQLMNPSSPVSAAPPPAAPTVARPAAPPPDAPAVASTIAAASAPQSVPVLSSAIPISSGRTPREVNVGDVLRGRYVIRGVIGRDSSGPVFEAIDRYRLDLQEAGQRVALMVLDAKSAERPGLAMDLRREFQLMQSLSHPNIVRAYGYDRDGDTEFFAMEYLSGLPLASVLAARDATPLARPYALAILRDVGAALAHAHSRGVVHGDLNASKVFITNDGEVRVQNFGAARASYNGVGAAESASLTGPLYASCQVLCGDPADARDDVYSCACLAYVLLSGHTPFADQTAVQARAQGLHPARPRAANAREWAALKAALSFDRDRRPADIADWLKQFSLQEATPRLPALLALTRGRPARPRRSLVPILAVVALCALAAGWWVMGHPGLSNRDIDMVSQESKSAMQSAGNSIRDLWHRSSGSQRTAAPSAAQAPAPSISSAPPPSLPPPAARIQAPSAAAAPAAHPAPAGPAAPTTHAAPAAPAARAVSAPPPAAHAVSLRSHIELSADTVDVMLGDPAARILVRRTGNLHGDLTFSWWTESGTAKPGQDYASVTRHQETIEDGKNFVNLYVPVVADSTRRQPKSFYVVIRDPPDATTLGRNLVMVTIPSSVE